MSITTRAAIARGPHIGWELVDLQLDEPKSHEVRVKFAASGLCHSDDHITQGDAPVRFPMVGGHEGAGIVESVGPDVRRGERRGGGGAAAPSPPPPPPPAAPPPPPCPRPRPPEHVRQGPQRRDRH